MSTLNNMDVVFNEYCEPFLEMCKSAGVRIVNGRCTGDTMGRTTCTSSLHRYGGSLLDYALVSADMLETI